MRVRSSLIVGLSALALCIGTAARAGAGGCHPVQAWTGPMTYNGACTHQGVDYAFCISAQAQGTLKGEYRFYGAADDWVEATPNAPITSPPYSVAITGITPPGTRASWRAGPSRSFTRSTATSTRTRRSRRRWASLTANIFGIYSSTSVIVGGTGRYAGASGWLGAIQNETVSTLIRGRVCTP